MQNYDIMIIDMINAASRAWKASPLVLGGIPTVSGGAGGPPGGFVGYLPQKRVAYDTSEAETDYTPPSGMTLLDNLNHIRFRLGALESGYNGHIIKDSTTEFAQRLKLQFLGNVTVVDDPLNDTTVVNIGSGIVFPEYDNNYYVAKNSGWTLLPTYDTVEENLSDQIGDENDSFFLSKAVTNVDVYLNGLLQLENVDFQLYEYTDFIYWLDTPPSTGDTLIARYKEIITFPSGSALLDIPDLELWWSADSISLTDGESITNVIDKSLNGRDGTGDWIFAPIYKTNVLATKPAMQFSTVLELYSQNLTSNELTFTDATCFVLWSRATTGEDLVLGVDATNLSYKQNGDDWYVSASDSQSIPMTVGVPYLKCTTFNGTEVERFTNGVSHGTQLTATPFKSAGVGYIFTPLNANLFEVAIYSRVLSEEERTKVEYELLHKYGMA